MAAFSRENRAAKVDAQIRGMAGGFVSQPIRTPHLRRNKSSITRRATFLSGLGILDRPVRGITQFFAVTYPRPKNAVLIILLCKRTMLANPRDPQEHLPTWSLTEVPVQLACLGLMLELPKDPGLSSALPDRP